MSETRKFVRVSDSSGVRVVPLLGEEDVVHPVLDKDGKKTGERTERMVRVQLDGDAIGLYPKEKVAPAEPPQPHGKEE